MDVIAAMVTAVSAAIGKYGASVLTRAEEAGEEATVGLGRRLLQKVLHRAGNSASVQEAVVDVSEAPTDDDTVAALRLQLKKALAADSTLEAEVTAMVRDAGMAVDNRGDRANIAQTNYGIQASGDSPTITQNVG